MATIRPVMLADFLSPPLELVMLRVLVEHRNGHQSAARHADAEYLTSLQTSLEMQLLVIAL